MLPAEPLIALILDAQPLERLPEKDLSRRPSRGEESQFHARVSDFIVDAVAICAGVGIAWTVRRLSDRYRLREVNSMAEPM